MLPLWAKLAMSAVAFLMAAGGLILSVEMILSAIAWRSLEPAVLAMFTLGLVVLGAVMGVGVWFP